MTRDTPPVARRFAVASSLMCADMLALGRDLRAFEEGRIDFLHLDIMDGHYVPNVSFGPKLCAQVGSSCTIPQDIHLMVEDVDRFIPMFAQVKPRFISFHPETSRHPVRTIQQIRSSGINPGIAIEPSMSIENVELLLSEVNLVCVMTVNPGFAGQSVIPWTLEKISELAGVRERKDLGFIIEADGNASWENIPRMVDAGAQIIVAGSSSLFDETMTRHDAIDRMNTLVW